MTRPDDSELEDYLAGNSAVSRAYHEGADETAPAELDAPVLAAGCEAVRKRRPAWRAPVAAAAMLVLALAVVLEVEYGAPPADKGGVTPEDGAPVAAAAPAAKTSDEALARRERATDNATASRSDDRVESAPSADADAAAAGASALGEASRPAQAGDYRDSPEAWLEHVRELLESGERTAAIEALEAFQEEHPDHELEPELAALLEDETAAE